MPNVYCIFSLVGLEFSRHKSANIVNNKYIYQKDLMGLQQCIGQHSPYVFPTQPSPFTQSLSSWEQMLSGHPDNNFIQYILSGLRDGFHIGLDYQHAPRPHPSHSNHPSVSINPKVVSTYLKDECCLGRVIGPVHALLFPDIHVSPFGIIPKKDKPGKWRLILDLSYPEGASVNSSISSELSSLTCLLTKSLKLCFYWARGPSPPRLTSKVPSD